MRKQYRFGLHIFYVIREFVLEDNQSNARSEYLSIEMEPLYPNPLTCNSSEQISNLSQVNDNSEYAFVFGAATGVVLTLFMRFYISTSITNQKNHNLKFLASRRSRYLFSLISLIVSVALLPFIFLLGIIFACYRYLVSLILQRKYGKKFGGLVSGRDVIWAVEDQSKNIVNVLMIAEPKENATKSVLETIKERVVKEVTVGRLRDSKLNATMHIEWGYLFLLKDAIHHSEYIVEMDTDDPNQATMSQEELRRKISKLGNLPMPKNHSGHWEVIVGKKPVNWSKHYENKCYPVLFRIHHSLGDGISLMDVLTKCFSDANIDILNEEIIENNLSKSYECLTNNNVLNSKSSNGETINNYENKRFGNERTTSNPLSTISETIRSIFRNMVVLSKRLISSLIILFFGPTSLILQLWIRSTDENALHGPELSGEKIFFWKVEEGERLVELIKSLRKRVAGATFLDILFTAVSASFHEYFQKRASKLPQFMTALIPARFPTEEKEISTDKFVITNNFTVALFNLPIDVKRPHDIKNNSNTSLIPRLRETMKQTNLMKRSIDFQVNYWIMTIFNAVIPAPFLRAFFKLQQYSMIISNLIGPESLYAFNGNRVRDLVFWLPNRGFVGVGISCLSYENRLQLGLIVDKALVSSSDNLQEILDQIPKYLDILDKETATLPVSVRC